MLKVPTETSPWKNTWSLQTALVATAPMPSTATAAKTIFAFLRAIASIRLPPLPGRARSARAYKRHQA